MNVKVDAPSADCVILFDCWTPVCAPDHACHGHALSLIAERMRQKGRKPWVFNAASNVASVQGLEKAGIQRRYSLVRRRAVGWQTIKGKTPRLDEARAAEVSARV